MWLDFLKGLYCTFLYIPAVLHGFEFELCRNEQLKKGRQSRLGVLFLSNVVYCARAAIFSAFRVMLQRRISSIKSEKKRCVTRSQIIIHSHPRRLQDTMSCLNLLRANCFLRSHNSAANTDVVDQAGTIYNLSFGRREFPDITFPNGIGLGLIDLVDLPVIRPAVVKRTA